MNFQLMSDLHLEFRTGEVMDNGLRRPEWLVMLEKCIVPDASKTVLILAGDIIPLGTIDPGLRSIAKAAFTFLCSKYRRVIYVLGNHEYYDTPKWDEVGERAKVLADSQSNLIVAHDASVCEVDGQRFILGTMWGKPIRDHYVIPGCWNPMFSSNKVFSRLLDFELQKGDIVVTHHLPSFDCVAPEYRTASNNSFFVSAHDRIILDRKPALWCFGHTHSPVNIRIGDTIVLANPSGYPHENVPFDPKFTFAVDKKHGITYAS